jgi:hypothetical protein
MFDTGSLTPGRLDLGGQWVTDVIENIQAGLDAVNYKSDTYEYKRQDLALIAPYITQVQGINNTVLAYEDFEVFFQDYSDFIDPLEYNESNEKWVLSCKSYAAKNGSFSPSWYKKTVKAKQDPYKKIMERTQAILKTYRNIFQPNFIWEEILRYPSSGGTYYEKFGALNAVAVKKSLIENYDSTASDGEKGSLTRQHWRGISGAALGSDDLKFVKEYLNEYLDIDTNDVRMVGNLTSKHEVETIFADNITKDRVTLGDVDIEVEAVHGMPFLKTNMLPDNILMFYVADESKPLLAELVSDIAEFTGMTFENEKSYEKFNRLDSIDDLKDGKFVIEDIGEHLIGRHRILFLDIAPSVYTGNTTRTIDATGLARIAAKRTNLHKQWYKTVSVNI